MMRRRSLMLSGAALALTGSGLASRALAQGGAQITGAGATFPSPLYQKWSEAGKAATGIEIGRAHV